MRLALWVANGVALNELAFMFLGRGLRVPAPGVEHYATLVLLSLPAIVAGAIHPGQRLTILNVVATVLCGAFMILVTGIGGAIGLVLAVLAGSCLGDSCPRLGLVAAMLATGSVLALGFWRHLRVFRAVAWVLPTVVAGTRLCYAPPVLAAHLDDGRSEFLVEAGMQCLPSDPDFRVCSVQTIVPGVFEWWHRVGSLPSNSADVSLRVDGGDLVVEAGSLGVDDKPIEHRIRVR